MRAAVLVVLAGCGRIRFDPLSPSDDAGVDAQQCMPVTGSFSTPVLVAGLNAPFDMDGTPSMTGDGLEIYFKSTRSGGAGDVDLWRSTRATTTSAWSVPVPVTELDTSAEEQSPEVARDGLTIWFASTRGGGQGDRDIWVATRTDRASAWSTPTPVVELNTSALDDGFVVLPSMLVGYLHSTRGGGSVAAVPHDPADADLAMGYPGAGAWSGSRLGQRASVGQPRRMRGLLRVEPPRWWKQLRSLCGHADLAVRRARTSVPDRRALERSLGSHLLTSSPIEIGLGVRGWMMWPRTRVPLALPRSSIVMVSPRLRTAWRREIDSSSIAMSHWWLRPIVPHMRGGFQSSSMSVALGLVITPWRRAISRRLLRPIRAVRDARDRLPP